VWLEHHVVIGRDPADVFSFMDDAETQARITPGVSELRNVQRLDNGGLACDLVYRVLGFELTESVRATAYDYPRYVEYDVQGPIRARLFGHYEPHEQGTSLRLSAYYELPSMFDNALMAPLVNRFNTWALEAMTRSMAKALESQADRRSSAA